MPPRIETAPARSGRDPAADAERSHARTVHAPDERIAHESEAPVSSVVQKAAPVDERSGEPYTATLICPPRSDRKPFELSTAGTSATMSVGVAASRGGT